MKSFLIKPVGKDLFEGISFEGKPGKVKEVSYHAALTTEELKSSKIYLLLKPRTFFYEIYSLNLPILNPKVIKLRLTERVNTLGYFSKPIDFCWKVLERKGEHLKIAYLALDSDELNYYSNLFRETLRCKLERMVFLPLALAANFSGLEQTSFILHREREGIWLLATKQGLPLLIEFMPVDELIGPNFEEVGRRLSFIKNILLRDFQEDIKAFYTTSSEIKEGLEKLGLTVELFGESNPELWGILKVDGAFDFLPEEERIIKGVMEFNKKASYILLGLAVFFLMVGLTLRYFNHNLIKEIQHKEGLLQESLQKLLHDYPEAKIAAFLNYLEERKKLKSAPKPDELLISIIRAFNGTKITLLEIKRQSGPPSPQVAPYAAQPNSTPQPGSTTQSLPGFDYSFVVEGEKKASPQEINSFAQELNKNLSTFLRKFDTKFDFDYVKGKINFWVKGTF